MAYLVRISGEGKDEVQLILKEAQYVWPGVKGKDNRTPMISWVPYPGNEAFEKAHIPQYPSPLAGN